MRGKSLALLALALGCGLVASIGITQVISKRNTQKQAPSGATDTIFVALEDIGLGEPLSSQILRLEQWPKDKVPPGALTKIEDVEGRRTRTKLWAGEPIVENKLYAKGEAAGGVTPLIPPGYRVVSVRVDSVSSSGSLIRPGDRVDVLVHLRRNPSALIMQTATRTILQDVKVFAVNDIVGGDSEKGNDRSIPAKTISLLVTPEDAEKTMLASQLGAIQLVMRGPDDDVHVALDGTPAQELYGGSPARNRTDEDPDSGKPRDDGFLKMLQQTKNTAQQSITNESAGPDQFKMRLMSGPVVSIVLLENNESEAASSGNGGFWKSSIFGVGGLLRPSSDGDSAGQHDDPESSDASEQDTSEEE